MHMEHCTPTGEKLMCDLEAGGSLPSREKRSGASPPKVEDFKADLGDCEGVKCVDTGEPIPALLVKAARRREWDEVVSFRTFRFVTPAECLRQIRF